MSEREPVLAEGAVSDLSGVPFVPHCADEVAASVPPAEVVMQEERAYGIKGGLPVGSCRFGVTFTGEALGTSHWLADSAACGDSVMALPSSVLVAGRTEKAGGVAVDMGLFLDAIMEGAAKLNGLAGIGEAASLPMWAVSRLFGVFPALMDVYYEAIDQAVLAVEAAAIKAAIGMKVRNTRRLVKKKRDDMTGAMSEEVSEEEYDKHFMPDPTLSKLILTSRMKGRYKDEGGVRQAVQINISGAEAAL